MKPAASAKTWRENKEKALTSSALLCLFRIVISNGGFQFCCCCFFSPTRPKTRKSQGVTNVRNRFFIQGLRHFLFVYVFTIILLLTFFRDLNNVTTLYCVLGCCFVFAFFSLFWMPRSMVQPIEKKASLLLRSQNLSNILSLTPGVNCDIALHAFLTAKNSTCLIPIFSFQSL